MLKATLLIVPCVAAELTAWPGYGEITDEAVLTQPAQSDVLIEKVNADPTSTWVAGRNARFEGLSIRDAKTLMGTKFTTDKSQWLPHRPLKHVDIPDEFDWRTDSRAAKCPSLKEVRDQSNCGSCWAFGSTEAMTDRICIASKGAKNVHLSAQDMTSCNHLGDMGCHGGIPPSAYTYYNTFGVVSGGEYGDKSGCWSYQMAPCAHHVNGTKYPACTGAKMAPLCAEKCTDNTALHWRSDKHHGKGGYSVCKQNNSTGDVEGSCAVSMAQEIYQNGPITAQFFVFQSFESYKSGVYTHKLDPTDLPLGGHAIKIIGYGNDAKAGPYWLVANSWNSGWGMDGFFKIARGKNNCQIEDSTINGGPVAGEPADN